MNRKYKNTSFLHFKKISIFVVLFFISHLCIGVEVANNLHKKSRMDLTNRLLVKVDDVPRVSTLGINNQLDGIVFAPYSNKLSSQWLMIAAQLGDPEAQIKLANSYYLHKNYAQSKYWNEQAALQNNPIAFYNLGQIYEFGEGVEIDLNQAVYWLNLAAEKSIHQAKQNLGVIFYNGGKGIKVDRKKAVSYFQQAADAGFMESQYTLGMIYAFGVPPFDKDIQLAKSWLIKAQQQGSLPALKALADLSVTPLFHGDDPVLKKESLFWITQAAQSGMIKPQKNLAEYYYQQQQYDTAYVLYLLSEKDPQNAENNPLMLERFRSKVSEETQRTTNLFIETWQVGDVLPIEKTD